MERIQAAIQKAKEQRGEGAPAARAPVAPRGPIRAEASRAATQAAWDALPAFAPDPRRMEKTHVVTFADADPAHAAFDMMRTKMLRLMRQNGWTSVGITSPTAGCGKTTTALNLAFSLSHQPDLRTVLLDLDLRRPAVAGTLGLAHPHSATDVLQGRGTLAENFVRIGGALAIGAGTEPVRGSSELLLDAATASGIAALKTAFAPDVILYDLPPMLQSDDVMAFLPHLDCVLLVAAAEQSRLDEVDKCEQDLAGQTHVLGVVLNKCRYTGEDYGYY